MTKRTAQKQSDDKKMGFIINYLITGFFILLFLIPILLTLSDSKYTLGWTFDNNSELYGINSQTITFTNGS